MRSDSGASAGSRYAEDEQDQAADRVGRAPAVVEQLVPGLVAASSPCPGGRRRAGRAAAPWGCRGARTVSARAMKIGIVGLPLVGGVQARLPLVELLGAHAPRTSARRRSRRRRARRRTARGRSGRFVPGHQEPDREVLVVRAHARSQKAKASATVRVAINRNAGGVPSGRRRGTALPPRSRGPRARTARARPGATRRRAIPRAAAARRGWPARGRRPHLRAPAPAAPSAAGTGAPRSRCTAAAARATGPGVRPATSCTACRSAAGRSWSMGTPPTAAEAWGTTIDVGRKPEQGQATPPVPPRRARRPGACGARTPPPPERCPPPGPRRNPPRGRRRRTRPAGPPPPRPAAASPSRRAGRGDPTAAGPSVSSGASATTRMSGSSIAAASEAPSTRVSKRSTGPDCRMSSALPRAWPSSESKSTMRRDDLAAGQTPRERGAVLTGAEDDHGRHRAGDCSPFAGLSRWSCGPGAGWPDAGAAASPPRPRGPG